MDQKKNVFSITNITHQRVQQENIIPLSSNKQEHALIYVLKGQGTVFYDKDFLGIKHHDVLLVDLEKNFYYSSDEMDVFLVIFSGDLLQEVLPNNHLFTIHTHQEFYESLLLLEHEKHASSYTIIKQFIHLLSFLHDQRNTYTLKETKDPMQKAIVYIENNFTNNIHMQDIADYTGFSNYYFIRKFKKYTNKTPYQYLLSMRLEHAKYLLKYTQKQIDEIAKNSGFQSDISFINSFTKHVKQSPTTYRKTKEK